MMPVRRLLLSIGLAAGVAMAHGAAGMAQGSARLAGWTLTPDGNPVADVEVGLACPPRQVRRTRSDSTGRFEFSGLPAANCRLIGRKDGYIAGSFDGDPMLRTPGGYNLHVRDGESRDAITIEMRRGATLGGRIFDEQGRPATKTYVHPVRREIVNGVLKLNAAPFLPLDADGRFGYGALPPGEYYVGAAPISDGYEGGGKGKYAVTYLPGVTSLDNAQLVTLKVGEAQYVEFALVPSRIFRVTGIAYDAAGNPAAGARVGVTLETDPKWIRGTGTTDARGNFVLNGIQPGKYRLGASKSGNGTGILLESGEIYVLVEDRDVEYLTVRMTARR